MMKSTSIAILLSMAVAVPAFAQRGGGRNGGQNGNQGLNGLGNQQDLNQLQNPRQRGGNGGVGGINGLNGNINPGGRNQLNGGLGVGPSAMPGGGRTRAFGTVTLPSTQDYQVLSSVSIFARDRRVSESSSSEETPVEVVRQPRQSGPAPTFVGVMKDDVGYVGLLEVLSRDGTSSVVPVHAGDAIAWDNSKVSEVSMDKLKLTGGQHPEIPLGYNLRNEPGQVPIPVVPYQSLDMTGRGNPAAGGGGQFGRQGRGGGGGGGFGQAGGFGTNGGFGAQSGFGVGGGGGGGRNGGLGGGGGFGAAGGGGFGLGNGGGGFANQAAPTPVITSDPPLPAGTGDDLEARMRARRAQQVGSPTE